MPRSSIPPSPALPRMAVHPRWPTTVGACLLAVAMTPVAAEPVPAAAHAHASDCVAVLKREVTALVPRYQDGQEGVRADIEQLTRWGFAFVGTAYKQGLRNPQADQMLEAAERAQASLPEAALQALSQTCRNEGAHLLAQANFVERALVNNRAKARVAKLLRPKPAEASSPSH